jgi:hypothetical protein
MIEEHVVSYLKLCIAKKCYKGLRALILHFFYNMRGSLEGSSFAVPDGLLVGGGARLTKASSLVVDKKARLGSELSTTERCENIHTLLF